MGKYTTRVCDRRAFVCKWAKLRHHVIGLGGGALALGLLTTLMCGCSKDSETVLFHTDEEVAEPLVSVSAGDTVVGFARGTIRDTKKTDAFKISKHPVTKKQYEQCQKAGACKEPKLDECSDPDLAKSAMKGDDDNVALCMGKDNAETFCRWVGGRLPTLAEWLRAARGPSVQKYPWGDTRATCAQHARTMLFGARAPVGMSTDGCASSVEQSLVTKTHPEGASKNSGMQDVLLSPAELLQGSADSTFAPCGKGQKCLVYGSAPAIIDSVRPYTMANIKAKSDGSSEASYVPMAYGFRCVVER